LQGDQVDAEHRLRHGVFDLEAGVHLQEVDVVPGDQELDGARARVGDRAGGGRRRGVQALLDAGGEGRRGGLLDHLLVAALEGAVAGAVRPHGAVGVGDDLHLDMASAFDVRLDEDRAVPEGALGLGRGGLQLAFQVGEFADDPHAAAAAARRRLHQDRQIGLGHRVRVEGCEQRHPGGGHQLLGAGLGGHRLDRLGRRADPDQARVEDGPREVGVLGQEAVAGVHGVRARVSAAFTISSPRRYVSVGVAPGRRTAVSATRAWRAFSSASE
jgi:hypothetical protein